MYRILCWLLVLPALSAQTAPRVNGVPVNDAELEALFAGMPPEMSKAMASNPAEKLRYYGFLQRMAALAEKDGLAKESPWKERIEVGRMMLLAQARMDQFYRDIKVSREEERVWYDAHAKEFEQARARVFHADDARKAAAEAARENAGEAVSIRRNGSELPAPLRDAIFALKPGQTSAPITQPNGVYIVRLESLAVLPFDQVHGEANARLRDERFQQWMDSVRKQVTVDVSR